MEKFLEMPAVMEERKDSNIVLEQRPDLEGYTECNMVFTDISQNTTNRVKRCLQLLKTAVFHLQLFAYLVLSRNVEHSNQFFTPIYLS